jgi:hypothetical protein
MRLLAALVAFAAISLPEAAHAFCQSTTNLDFVPSDGKPCDTEGKKLFWASRCITMLVNRKASTKVSLEETRDLLGKAFAMWSGVSCDACGATGQPSLVGTEGGATDCGFELVRDGTNTNVLLYYDDAWPREPGQLALTTVRFKIDTGEIIDADLEINAAENITLTGDDGSYDLDSIITHEVGHVLGLAHSADPESTMRTRYPEGDTSLRTLAEDDICGICAAAPPGREAACTPTSGTCTPGTTPPDGGTITPDGGTPTPNTAVGNKADDPGYTCSCSTPGHSAPFPYALLGLLIVSRLRSRIARASRSRGSSCTSCSR